MDLPLRYECDKCGAIVEEFVFGQGFFNSLTTFRHALRRIKIVKSTDLITPEKVRLEEKLGELITFKEYAKEEKNLRLDVNFKKVQEGKRFCEPCSVKLDKLINNFISEG